MLNNLDIDKARIFLRYLAKAVKETPKTIDISPKLSERIRHLSKRLDKFIQLQETKKFATTSREDIRAMLETDLARIKKILIKAKQEKADPEKLYHLVERAEKIKERIKNL